MEATCIAFGGVDVEEVVFVGDVDESQAEGVQLLRVLLHPSRSRYERFANGSSWQYLPTSIASKV